jgi:hypothetical protein
MVKEQKREDPNQRVFPFLINLNDGMQSYWWTGKISVIDFNIAILNLSHTKSP